MEIISNKNELQHLYVITTIFNPAGFKKRYNLYHNFEKHMSDYGINLVTIECIFGDNTEFHVTKPDNPLHIRVSAKDPLWVKENLINIAIKKLPNSWKYVLWLDADIEFIDKYWPIKILESFKMYDVIQVFKYANFLGPRNEILECHYSFLFALVNDLPIKKSYYSQFYPHPGYGWGMTRIGFEKIGNLIDIGIVGSGDSHMAFGFIHRALDSLPIKPSLFNYNYLKSLFDWQNNVKSLLFENKLGYADVVINHYFHGFREDRQYVLRMYILTEMQFDPINDIYYNDQGVIQLNENRNDIKSVIKKYFRDRNEDIAKNDDSELKSMNLPFKFPEKVLESANQLKQLLERESFKKMKENIIERRGNDTKRRNSSISLTRRPPLPRPKKTLEMYIEMNLGNDTSKSSTDSSHSSSDSKSDRNFLSPEKTHNLSFDDNKMVRKYGTCCSKSSVENKQQANSRTTCRNNNGNNNYQMNQGNLNYNNSEERKDQYIIQEPVNQKPAIHPNQLNNIENGGEKLITVVKKSDNKNFEKNNLDKDENLPINYNNLPSKDNGNNLVPKNNQPINQIPQNNNNNKNNYPINNKPINQTSQYKNNNSNNYPLIDNFNNNNNDFVNHNQQIDQFYNNNYY